MLSIFAITFPFFALVLCGYLAARRGLLPPAGIPGLNTFVLYFALPCMLYRFGAGTPTAQLLDGSLAALWLVGSALVVALAVLLARRRGLGWNDAAFGALVANFPNTGFMGVPLLVALLGAAAAGPCIVTIALDMVVTSSVCIALSRLDGADEHGAARAARHALRGVLVNPLPWAILLGGLSSATGVALPGPVMSTVGLLADAASPVALFTIGAVLARSQMGSATTAARPTPLADYLPIVVVKLAVQPLLVGGLGLAAIALGLPLARQTLVVVVLVAALPSASNVAMLAERFGADNGRIARIILMSTVLAFFSFPVVVALLT